MADNVPFRAIGRKKHRWRELSFKNQDSSNYVTREQLKEKIEEYLKRGGIIKKLQPLDTLVLDVQILDINEQDKWIDQGWKL